MYVCGISKSVWEGWKFCSTYSSTYVNFPIENFWPLRKSHHEQLENWIFNSLSRYDEKSLTSAKFSIFFFFISCTFCAHSSSGSLLSAFLYFLIIALAHFTNFQCAAIKIAIKNFNTFLSAVECESCHWTLIATLLIALLLLFSLFLIYILFILSIIEPRCLEIQMKSHAEVCECFMRSYVHGVGFRFQFLLSRSFIFVHFTLHICMEWPHENHKRWFSDEI